MIVTRGLARSFKGRSGEVEAVRGIDLEVGAGQVVGLLGPNGAGKTTTVRMLTTLLDPSAGSARIDGFDVVAEREQVRRRIGLVGQGGSAGAEHRVIDELRTQGRLHGLDKRAAAERADKLCADFGLVGLEDRLAKTLSGGQQRRVDIALGLVARPKVLFLDEPTAGLDPQSRAVLWDHVRALRAEHGVTVLLTTHLLDEADRICDRIAIVDQGRIIADDTPEALKDESAGDTVLLGTDRVDDAARAVARVAPEGRVDTSEGTVQLRVVGARRLLPALLRELDREGIELESVTVKRPSLDDVFLARTGRSVHAEAEAPADAADAADAPAAEPAVAEAPAAEPAVAGEPVPVPAPALEER
ncbi:ATP-binding cassette domain-containing protein [Kitasatospora sp. NPDC088391]|uniref:ABC transporter ATP-binding protein n=1 Tax=Kitasatospora sp. NPDC088391 TaxID=3364074 RepID=UPI00381E125F